MVLILDHKLNQSFLGKTPYLSMLEFHLTVTAKCGPPGCWPLARDAAPTALYNLLACVSVMQRR